MSAALVPVSGPVEDKYKLTSADRKKMQKEPRAQTTSSSITITNTVMDCKMQEGLVPMEALNIALRRLAFATGLLQHRRFSGMQGYLCAYCAEGVKDAKARPDNRTALRSFVLSYKKNTDLQRRGSSVNCLLATIGVYVDVYRLDPTGKFCVDAHGNRRKEVEYNIIDRFAQIVLRQAACTPPYSFSTEEFLRDLKIACINRSFSKHCGDGKIITCVRSDKVASNFAPQMFHRVLAALDTLCRLGHLRRIQIHTSLYRGAVLMLYELNLEFFKGKKGRSMKRAREEYEGYHELQKDSRGDKDAKRANASEAYRSSRLHQMLCSDKISANMSPEVRYNKMLEAFKDKMWQKLDEYDSNYRSRAAKPTKLIIRSPQQFVVSTLELDHWRRHGDNINHETGEIIPVAPLNSFVSIEIRLEYCRQKTQTWKILMHNSDMSIYGSAVMYKNRCNTFGDRWVTDSANNKFLFVRGYTLAIMRMLGLNVGRVVQHIGQTLSAMWKMLIEVPHPRHDNVFYTVGLNINTFRNDKRIESSDIDDKGTRIGVVPAPCESGHRQGTTFIRSGLHGSTTTRAGRGSVVYGYDPKKLQCYGFRNKSDIEREKNRLQEIAKDHPDTGPLVLGNCDVSAEDSTDIRIVDSDSDEEIDDETYLILFKGLV